MPTETPREIMHRADGIRERARALNQIIQRMRVREAVTQQGKHFFSRGKDPGVKDIHLTAQEDQLFYEWACDQRARYEREADELDARLTIKPESDDLTQESRS